MRTIIEQELPPFVNKKHAVNIIMGVLLLSLLFLYSPWFSSQLVLNSEAAVRSMLLLLDWLMGIPAGLKLNGQLTVFLGKFFTYHVWLWAGYISLIAKHFDLILQAVGVFGLLGGASLQIAIIQDLINLLTLHLFCFYIYSARLYSLVIQSLLSLWRLFRGLKWNSLRSRVDHASYDITQLFIGTLLFSILLFVLPTVFLYYVVFTTFRLMVVGTQKIFHLIRSTLNQRYALIQLMILWNSQALRDVFEVLLSPVSTGDITVLIINQTLVAAYSDVVSLIKMPVRSAGPKLLDVVRKVIVGEIL